MKNIIKLKKYIKNQITITLYNIHIFINLDKNIKYELLEYAIKYNHDDVINILIKN
jgi:hypothetical protein